MEKMVGRGPVTTGGEPHISNEALSSSQTKLALDKEMKFDVTIGV
jgi:hypothetical protein